MLFSVHEKTIATLFSQFVQLRSNQHGRKIGRHNKSRFDDIKHVINNINSLLIPYAWVGIDYNAAFHVTNVYNENVVVERVRGPAALNFKSDFVWEYFPWNLTVRCGRCRNGSVNVGTILQCEKFSAK